MIVDSLTRELKTNREVFQKKKKTHEIVNLIGSNEFVGRSRGPSVIAH